MGENVLPGQTTGITIQVDGTLSFNSTITDNHAATNSLVNAADQSIQFTGTGTFLKTGTGSLAMLSGNYSSATTGYGVKFALSDGALIDIQAGTLRNGGYTHQNWTENMADLRIANDATLNVWDGAAMQVDSLVGAGTLTSSVAKNFTIGAANSTWSESVDADGNPVYTAPEFSGTITNTVSLVKVGTGTQIFSGSFTSTGSVTISAGTLQIGNGIAGSLGANTAISVAGGATLVLNTPFYSPIIGTTLTGAGNVVLQSGSIVFPGNTGSWTGSLSVRSGAAVTLESKSLLSRVSIADGALPSFYVNDSDTTNAWSSTEFNAFRTSGTYPLVKAHTPTGVSAVAAAATVLATNEDFYKTGAGTLALSGSSTTFNSDIIVEGGSLSIGTGTNGAAAISNEVDVQVSSGASFVYDYGTGTTTVVTNQITGAGGIVVASGTVQYTADSPKYTTATATTTGMGIGSSIFKVAQVTIRDGATLSIADGVTPTFDNMNGTITIESGGTLEWTSTAGENHYFHNSAQIFDNRTTINGAGTLVKKGSGSVALLSRYGYNGTVTVSQSAGGWIDVSEGVFINGGWGTNINWAANQGSINVAGGAKFNIWDQVTITIDSLTGAGTVERGALILGVANNVNNATYGVENNTAEFSGIIQNGMNGRTGAVTKRGTGTQILSGNNTYTGTTVIENGTLQVGKGGESGAIGTGAVTVSTMGALVYDKTTASSISSLSGHGTVRTKNTGVVTITNLLNQDFDNPFEMGANATYFHGTFDAQTAGSTISIVGGGVFDGKIMGEGVVQFVTAADTTLDLSRASVTGTVSMSGGTLLVGNGTYEGTLQATEDTTMRVASKAGSNPWQLTMYTGATSLNGRVTPTSEALYVINKNYAFNMDQCANNTDSALAGAYISSYSALSYTTPIYVSENVTLDFSGQYDDTQGVWVLECDANGNPLEGATWQTLLSYNSNNCVVNTATGVELSSGYYLMDVRVADQTGDHYAITSVTDADEKRLGIGMRISGSEYYSAMDIDPTTGVIGGSDGKIVSLQNDSTTKTWTGSFDIADGKTITFDNDLASATSYVIDTKATGTGTLRLSNSAGGSIPYDVTIDSEGSLEIANDMTFSLAGNVDGNLSIGDGSTWNFTVDTGETYTDAIFTALGDVTLGADSIINILISGDAPTGDAITIGLVDAGTLTGFDSILGTAFENILANDPDMRYFTQISDGRYYLTVGSSASIPEPSTWVLLMLGVGIAAVGRYRSAMKRGVSSQT
ncbi:MAG: autotransporter-associated beta strand repeat-containing protein [Planctomycetia bacterium]|nr:autotransporter-associated beta strand repeat-containing protein [Planctomycetia bacterium]